LPHLFIAFRVIHALVLLCKASAEAIAHFTEMSGKNYDIFVVATSYQRQDSRAARIGRIARVGTG
jgi:hypothetical protein